MKQTYKIELPSGGTAFESTDLYDFIKTAEMLKDRGTGKTTRMLFQAMGDPSEKILIIGKNLTMVDHLIRELLKKFEALGFEYTRTHKNIVRQFGKEYRFLSEAQYGDDKFWDRGMKQKYVKYFDNN